jgi:predicted house-cleaning noncanonical NTP pyrophosphatase (MazG superfamily)
MLYNKGAEIGLRRDGIVTKSDDERIEAERILNEPVDEVHHQSERVINPAIGEIVAMMGQIDEFKRIRARVKQAAISEKFKPEDVDKLDKEVQEFLDDPEVKDSLEQLEVATIALAQSDVKLAAVEEQDPDVSQIANKITQANGNFVDIFPGGVPENYDFYGDKRIIEAVAKSLPTIQGAAKYLSDPKVVAEYVAEQIKLSDFVHACLVALNHIRKRWDDFKISNPGTVKLIENALWLAVTSKLKIFKNIFSIGKTIWDGVEILPRVFRTNPPGGLTLATPNGATVTGALEAVPSIAVEGTGAGIITTAAGALLPDDFTSLSFARKADGKDHAPKIEPTPKERIRRTGEDVTNHFKKLGKDGWERSMKDGKKIYINKDTGEKRWADYLHNEIECNKGNKSWVIDPVTEKVLDKKGHLLKEK